MSDEQKKDEQWSALIRVIELFRRYYSGEASQREQNSIETWEPMENEEELINDKNLEKDCDTVTVWKTVSHELKFDQQPRFSIQRNFQRRYAAAAVIFILLGGSIVYYTQHDFIQEKFGMVAQAKTLFQTTDDQTRLVILPDGSRIEMNRGTKFSYATHAFNRKQREVWLEGEAFFEVAKNKEKPFIIHTGTMATTVRGTSFNVKAYPQLAEKVVSVRSGKVEVNDDAQTLGLLTHNKQLTYNTANKKTQIAESNWEDAAGWREGRLVFRRAGTNELKLRLKQYFNVELEIKDKAINDNKTLFNSSFGKRADLKEVMDVISMATNVKYEIKEDRKVIIYSEQ